MMEASAHQVQERNFRQVVLGMCIGILLVDLLLVKFNV